MFYLKSFYRYHIVGTFNYWKAKQSLKSNQNPILVYTMAKVGSMSVYNSLRKDPSLSVFHMHTLKQEEIKKAYQICRSKGWWPDSKSAGHLIYKQIIKENKPVKIISIIRDPIARNISAFFEVFPYFNDSPPNSFDGNINSLQKRFLEKVNHNFPLQWFQNELQHTTTIDVFSKPFDQQEKYQHFKKENVELLLIKLNLPDIQKEKIIRSFLNSPNFKLSNSNIGAQKKYAPLYQSFLKQINLPETYVHSMLESDYVKHFFSKDEIKSLYQQWIRV